MTAVLLRPAAEDSPATPTRVDPGDFQASANAFAAEQPTIMRIMDDLRSGLAANSPCIGQDNSATYFAGRYGPAGEAVMNGCAALYAVIGNIAQGLAQAGTDHSRADAISATNWSTTNYQTITVNTSDSINPQVVPTITGYEPSWLPSVLNNVWPCKDDGKLAGSAQAWRTAQQSLTDLQSRLHSALTALVDNNQGPDLDALEQFWSQFTTGSAAIFPALNTAIDSIVAGLNTYGQTIDDFNRDIKEAILEAAVEAGAEEVVFIIIDLATDGFGTLFTGPEGAAVAAQAANRLATVVEQITAALQRANGVETMTAEGTTALTTAIQDMPQPKLATNKAWQAGDDIQPGVVDAAAGVSVAQLKEHGHVVRTITDSGIGRTPDTLVDGEPTEIKTLDASSPAQAIFNALKKVEARTGQAPNALINAEATSINPADAQAVLDRYMQEYHKGVLQRVTIWLSNGQKVTYPDGYGGL